MFALPVLTTPLLYCVATYKTVYFKICEQEKTWADWVKRFWGIQNYLHSMRKNPLPIKQIKKELEPILNQAKMTRDITIIERATPDLCAAQGSTFSTSDAVIWIFPTLYQLDKEMFGWLIKHEISHLKNNDALTMSLTPAICSFAMAFFSVHTMPIAPATLITAITGFAIYNLFSQYCEEKADNFALANCSLEELKGGRRFLISARKQNLICRQAGQTLTSSPSGEFRLDISHPSLKSRLEKIENKLKKSGVLINAHEEEKKISDFSEILELFNKRYPDDYKIA